MTALLVLAFCVICLAVDYVYIRKRGRRRLAERQAEAAPPGRRLPQWVAGFGLPEQLLYHPGHTWALAESPHLVRVGLDDFAAHLLGQVASIVLPQRGRWIRQGQPLATVYRDGVETKLVSPIEGVIADVNEAVKKDPSLALKDPYGEGWLISVQAPDEPTNFRNLLSGRLARRWMEEAAERLRARIPSLAGAVAQDGGLAAGNLTEQLPDANWEEITREFFLT
jgi:glycine cleavage system H protein